MKRREVVEIDTEIVPEQNYWLDIIRKAKLVNEELLWTGPGHCFKYTTEKSLNEQYQYVLIMHYLETV